MDFHGDNFQYFSRERSRIKIAYSYDLQNILWRFRLTNLAQPETQIQKVTILCCYWKQALTLYYTIKDG